MADLQTKPHAWLRKLSVRDLKALVDRIKDSGPIGDCPDNYGYQQTIDGHDYRIPVVWVKFELQVREQLAAWSENEGGK